MHLNGDGSIHYDADASPHVNLISTRCHRVEDFTGVSLARITQRIAQDSGYHLRGARVAYYGLCPRCQKTTDRSPLRWPLASPIMCGPSMNCSTFGCTQVALVIRVPTLQGHYPIC